MSKIDIKKKTIKSLLDTNGLQLPIFQRELVWKNNLRQDLISSVMNDYPIGAITLFKNEGYLHIIDGLQRLSALKLFTTKPNDIFKWKKLNEQDYFSKIMLKISDYIGDEKLFLKITSYIKKWYEDDFSDNVTSLVNFFKYMNNLELSFIEPIHDILRTFFTMQDVFIPCIIYTGSWDEAAEIFENMNRGSVTLSKYEIFAAKWSNYKCINIPQEIENEIENRYSLIETMSFNSDIKQYNFFDYALGLSMTISKSVDLKFIVPRNKLKQFDNLFIKDEIFLEILSALIYNDPTKVDTCISNLITHDKVSEVLQLFMFDLAMIIKKTAKEYIDFTKDEGLSKVLYYQTLYNIVKSIKLKYIISIEQLSIKEYSNSFVLSDFSTQIDEGWFENDNRQKIFLVNKLEEVNKFIENQDI